MICILIRIVIILVILGKCFQALKFYLEFLFEKLKSVLNIYLADLFFFFFLRPQYVTSLNIYVLLKHQLRKKMFCF